LTVDMHGNTSAASIPLALFGPRSRTGRVKKGDLVLLEAMGGGFYLGARPLFIALVRARLKSY